MRRGGFFSEPAGVRGLTIALIVLLCTVFFGLTVYFVQADMTVDFYAYYLASECVARNVNPYELSETQWNAVGRDLDLVNWQFPYRYPPQTAVLLLALRPLGPRDAAIVWGLLNAAALIAGAYLLGRITGKRWGPPVTLAMLLLFYPAYNALRAGQVSGLLFLFLVLALWALNKGRDTVAGASLAIATVLKVFPVMLIIYVVWRRRWRCACVALILVAGSFLLCLPFAGYDMVASYPSHALALTDPGRVDPHWSNQTLTATLARLLMGNLSNSAILELSRVLALVIVAATYGLCWPRGHFRQWANLEFAFVIPLCLLLPAFSFPHWLVILLIPAAVVLERLVTDRRQLLLIVFVGLFLAASIFGGLLLTESMQGHVHSLSRFLNDLLHNEGWRLLSLPFLFTMALWLLLASYLLPKFRRPVQGGRERGSVGKSPSARPPTARDPASRAS